MAPPPAFTEAQLERLVHEYNEGVPGTCLATKYGVHWNTVYRYLRERTVVSRRDVPRRTRGQEVEILRRYKQGYSAKKLAREVGASSTTVVHLIERAGILVRGRNPKRTFNKNVFCKLDARTAYWLGFLLADGCVVTKGGTYELSLTLKDHEHVEKFRSFLGSDHKISQRGPYSHVGVCNRELGERLIAWGVKPRKSLSATVHPKLKNNVDFWRGMVDGDGYIGRTKSCSQINLYGTRAVTADFARWAAGVGSKVRCPEKHYSIFKIRFYGQDAFKILRALRYNRSCEALQRKQRVAVALLAQEA